MASKSALLLLAGLLAADEVPAISFRAETVNIALRELAAGPPVADIRLGLIADQPRGCQVLRLEAPRFRSIGSDSGERLAVLIRPSSRSQDVVGDRSAQRDRAVRLALDVSPPRDTVRQLLGLQGSVRLVVGLGLPRLLLVPLLPPPAKPVPVEGLADCAVQVEDLKNGRVALLIPAELARRLGDPLLLDADGVPLAPRPGQRSQSEGQGLRIQYDLGQGGTRIQLPWYADVRTVDLAITVPSLSVPGGIPGIGDATAPHPRPPTRPAPRQPLHRAVADGDAAVIDWLLLADAAALERPEGDLRPLQRAVVIGRLPLVERLLAAGADATVRTRDGRSLLSLAIEAGDEELARFFLKRGGDPAEVAAATGWTLLHQAVNADAPALVRLLLEAGVDPWAEAKDGRSAIDLARDQARWPLLRMLLGNP